ncbi:MAG: hypothetical protein GY859_25785, partial [Desulfobacterales bacterium]|nr:hypothetical protein [Desulfobacterales bacterium]
MDKIKQENNGCCDAAGSAGTGGGLLPLSTIPESGACCGGAPEPAPGDCSGASSGPAAENSCGAASGPTPGDCCASPAGADGDVCCGAPAGPESGPLERTGYTLCHFVEDFKETPAGPAPRVKAVLDRA